MIPVWQWILEWPQLTMPQCCERSAACSASRQWHHGLKWTFVWLDHVSYHLLSLEQLAEELHLKQTYLYSTTSKKLWAIYNPVLWLLIHMSNIWIYVISHVCSASQPAILGSKKFNVGHYMQTFRPNFFHTCHAYRNHWLLPCDTTFSDLNFGWGSQGHCKAQPVCFIFSHTFQMVRMKSGLEWKLFQIEHPKITFEFWTGKFCKKGEYGLFEHMLFLFFSLFLFIGILT